MSQKMMIEIQVHENLMCVLVCVGVLVCIFIFIFLIFELLCVE